MVPLRMPLSVAGLVAGAHSENRFLVADGVAVDQYGAGRFGGVGAAGDIGVRDGDDRFADLGQADIDGDQYAFAAGMHGGAAVYQYVSFFGHGDPSLQRFEI
jgi:hypothetical protein